MPDEKVRKPIPEHLKEKMTLVLEAYGRCGVIGHACDESGVRRRSHSLWVKEYEDYAEMFETVRERFVDGLELVAIDRAKEKSDSLLQMLLRANRPEVYGDKSEVQLKAQQGGGIQLVFASGMLSEEEKKILMGKSDVEET